MTTTQQRELEDKFDVGADFVLPDLSGVPGVGGVGQPEEHQLDATYYDTPDMRLAAARVTLRRRTGGADAGWHVKLPEGDGARRELRRPAGRAAAAPPKAVLEPVLGLVRRAPVGRIARVQTRRTVTPVTAADGHVLAEVADDAVTATTFASEPGSPAVVTSWREIEVELLEGNRALLEQLGSVLVAAGARPSPYPSKLGRALGDRARGLAAPTGAVDGNGAGPHLVPAQLAKKGKKGKKGKAAAPGKAARRALRAATTAVEHGATAGDVVVAGVRAQLEALQQADVMVRTGAPDGIHQVRVACRRLRSTLAAERTVLDRGRTDPLREELQWLGGELSTARDREVALAHLRELVAAQPVELVLGPVAARLQEADLQEGAAGQEHALRALGTARYFSLLDSLEELVSAPPLTGDAGRPAGDVLGEALAHAGRRMRKRLEAARAATAPEAHDLALHEVRKAAKRARYTAEVACPVVDPEATGLIEAMKQVQEVLGIRQDTVVTRALCRQLGVEAFAAGENAWTYGRLHALEQGRSDQAERDFWELAPSVEGELRRAGRGG